MSKSILLVEDNSSDIELTRRAFIRARILNELVVAEDGQAALDYLLGDSGGEGVLPPLPALVLLDLKLPKVDGLEVLRRLKNDPKTKTIPVVVLTSSAAEQDIVKSYQLGVNGYVTKPIDFAQFTEAVRQLGIYWLAINQPPHYE